jgi:hypothetical protein
MLTATFVALCLTSHTASHTNTTRPVPQAAASKRPASSTKAKGKKRASKAAAAAGSSTATTAKTSSSTPALDEKQLMAIAQAACAHVPVPAVLLRPVPQPGEDSHRQQRRSRHSDCAARWADIVVTEAGALCHHEAVSRAEVCTHLTGAMQACCQRLFNYAQSHVGSVAPLASADASTERQKALLLAPQALQPLAAKAKRLSFHIMEVTRQRSADAQHLLHQQQDWSITAAAVSADSRRFINLGAPALVDRDWASALSKLFCSTETVAELAVVQLPAADSENKRRFRQ